MSINNDRIVYDLLCLLKKGGKCVLEGKSKLVLPVSVLQRVNTALQQLDNPSLSTSPPDDLLELQRYVSQTPKMKVTQMRSALVEVDITRFVNLRYIEIVHVHIPIHQVKGLQALRPQLEFLVCHNCYNVFENVLGGEENSIQVWEELRTVSLARNKIEVLSSRMFASTPWIQYLDLSNNKISDKWCLENLNNLKHLNLSYNCLDSLPTLSEDSYQKLEVLLLKHNLIEDISEIWLFKNLNRFDVSYNILDDYSTFPALMELHNLQHLNLEGNPISYHPKHRLLTCSCLSKAVPVQSIILDNTKLSKKEIITLGTRGGGFCYNIRRSRAPKKPLPKVDEDFNSEATISRLSEGSSGMSKSISSRKMPRIREAIIVNADVAAYSEINKVTTPVTPTLEGPPPEHLETKKQLEHLRQRVGKDHWLHSHAGSFVQDLLGLQKTPCPSGLIDDDDLIKLSDDEGREKSLNVTATSSELFYTPHSNAAPTTTPSDMSFASIVDSDTSTIKKTPTATQLQYSDTDTTSDYESNIDNNKQKGSQEEQKRDEAKSFANEPEDDDGDNNDDEGYPWLLVQKVVSPSKFEEVFLVIKETELKEKDPVTGDTLVRWGLSTLESCAKISAQPPTVQLTFDTIRRLCQERTYVMEEGDSLELMQKLGVVLESRPLSEMKQTVFRCMKCSAVFSRELKATIHTPKEAHCQNCGSNLVLQVNEDEHLPSNCKTALATTPVFAAPEPKLSTSPSQCSIASESDETGTAAGTCLSVVADVHLTNYQHEDNDSSYSAWSAASLDQSSRESPAGGGAGDSHGQSQTATPRRCDSDIEVISNPSQSSIEVLEVQARLQASGTGTPNRKRSSEERQTVAVPQLVTVPEVQPGNTGLTESSSSGSLTDSICTTYENHAPLIRRLPSQGSVGVTVPEETSTENSPSAATTENVPCPPQSNVDGNQSPLKSFHSLPNTNYASILENLLQNVSSKLEHPKQFNSAVSDDSVQYSFDDLSQVDHRIKLFLYQGLFTNEEEHLVLLIRATIVDRKGQKYPGCFVVSTRKCFILKIVSKESGDDASEFLQKEYASNLTKLKSITSLPWLQGVTINFQGDWFLLLLHDVQRTRQFFTFVNGVKSSLPDICSVDSLSSDNEDSDSSREDQYSLTIQHLLLTSTTRSETSPDVDAIIRHLSLPVTVTVTRDNVPDEIVPFASFGVTGSDLFLLTGDLSWMFPSSTTKPSLQTRQSMINLMDISMNETTLNLHFLDESEGIEETWVLSYQTASALDAIIKSIKTPWESLFSVPLQITKS